MEITLSLILKISIIIIIVIVLSSILYIKYTSDFFSENSLDNKIKDFTGDPKYIDDDFLKSLEYQTLFDSKLDNISKELKNFNTEIINYKLKLDNIDKNIEDIRNKELSIKQISTIESEDMIK